VGEGEGRAETKSTPDDNALSRAAAQHLCIFRVLFASLHGFILLISPLPYRHAAQTLLIPLLFAT
jgi:hypothetical protein